jgi:hypothetical protein
VQVEHAVNERDELVVDGFFLRIVEVNGTNWIEVTYAGIAI